MDHCDDRGEKWINQSADGYNRTWTLERPFGGSGGGVPINADSFISVFERREHMIIRDNHFSDGGPMQM